MSTLKPRLIQYLEDLTGSRPDVVRLPEARGDILPLFLRDRYSLYSAQLFGHGWIFACDSPDWELGTPQEYAGHVEILQRLLGGERVIIVLDAMPSWTRNRLVRAGVPFIVPGNQMFLPPFTVDLRERSPSPVRTTDKALTPAAQAVFIYHLLKTNLNGRPLKEIAGMVGYSSMMLSKVKDEFEAAGLCISQRKGRFMTMEFPGDKKSLWEQGLPRLRSPVSKEYWIDWQNPGYPALAAGLTALSHRTIIADDPLPTYALYEATFRGNLEHGTFRGCPDSADATIRLEAWAYNPLLFAKGNDVDPLSLYLSLRESADERVQQQLELSQEEIPW
jgi:hypothetical protein